MTKNIIFIVPMFILAMAAACRRADERILSPEALSCQKMVSEFNERIQREEKRFKKSEHEVRRHILALTNRFERLQSLRELASVIKSVPLKNYSVSEKDDLEHLFYEIPEFIACSLFTDGASEKETGDLLVEGFRKYRELCCAFGSETDMTDGNGRWAQYRRKVAQCKRQNWEHSLVYFETVGIQHVFGARSPEAAKRFLERWHKEFGCHNKDCPEWKNLSTNAPAPCPKANEP